MNSKKIILSVIVLVLIGGTAGALVWFKDNQKLGDPGLRVIAKPGTVLVDIPLPEEVLDYTSIEIPQPAEVTNMLPKDTSFASRIYTASDSFWVQLNIVLMGMDRTSIHKPEYCLPSQGWQVTAKEVVPLRIEGPTPYEMPIARWTMTQEVQLKDGGKQRMSALYVFWFVAENEVTTSHGERIRLLTRDLLKSGVLQRWAYVSYFAPCATGMEDLAFERVKQLVATTVPEFQKPPARLVTAVDPVRASGIVRN